MGFKKDAQGVRDSDGYRANDSLNHNIKDAFKPFVKDPKNALKDGDILCLVNIGTKPNSPKFNRKDFKPVLSVEQSEKKRIAQENRENAENLAFLNKIQEYANGLDVQSFDEWYKALKDNRTEFLKKKIANS
jgi:molybdopterin converting factor small subunit